MTTYEQLRAEIDQLRREAEAAREAEKPAVIEELRRLIALFELTAADLGLGKVPRPARPGAGRKAPKTAYGRISKGLPRYRDPASGLTWTGVGRRPQWILQATDRESLRIDAGSREEPGAGTNLAEVPARAPGASGNLAPAGGTAPRPRPDAHGGEGR